MAYARNNSLIKSFQILEVLNDSNSALSATEIAFRTAIPLGTAHRFLKNLSEMGYVGWDEAQKRYSIGFSATLFGNRRQLIERIVKRSRTHISDLGRRTGMTVYLGSLEGPQVVVEATASPAGGLRSRQQAGSRIDAHAHSLGKALLAHIPPRDVTATFSAAPLRRHTRRTILLGEQLIRGINTVRRQGYAVDDEEFEVGYRSIAKALVNPKGRALCAIALEVPCHSCGLSELEGLLPHLSVAAERILKPLG